MGINILVYTFLIIFIASTFNAIAWNVDNEKNHVLKYNVVDYLDDEKITDEILRNISYDEKCKCRNGFCEADNTGKMIFKCHPEWGLFTKIACKECDCGKGANCTFVTGLLTTVKHCICKEGYEDIKGRCKGSCSKNPCKNDGTCIYDGLDIICICKSQFSGELCEINQCNPNPCQNKGTCNVVSGKIKCMCKDPFFGERCERKIPPNSTDSSRLTTENIDHYGTKGTTDKGTKSTAVYVSSTEVNWSDLELNTTTSTTETIQYRRTSDPEFYKTEGKTILWTSTRNLNSSVSSTSRVNGTLATITKSTFNVTSTIAPTTVTTSCKENPCKNGGICQLEGNSKRCYCISPYSGVFCENDTGNCKYYLIISVLSTFIATFLPLIACFICYNFRLSKTSHYA